MSRHLYKPRHCWDDLNSQDNKWRRQMICRVLGRPTGGYVSDQEVLRFKCWMEQDGIDVYSGEEISIADAVEPPFDSRTGRYAYELDHIVPQSRGGTDADVNRVLVRSEFNLAKTRMTPYEWMHATSEGELRDETLGGAVAPDWDAFCERVSSMQHLPEQKKRLLLGMPRP